MDGNGARRQDAVGAGGLVDPAEVADDDVVAVIPGDRVVADDERVGVERGAAVRRRDPEDLRREAEARRQVEVEPVVTVDVVVAGEPVDRVVARAAGEVVAVLAAGDRVVADAAVDRHGAGGAACVDRVVARERRRARELAAVAGDVRRDRVVEAAVLGCVAEQDQRRAGAADRCARGRVRGQHVVATAALDDGDRPGDGLGNVEVVVVAAEQDVDDLDVVVGDAAVERANVRVTGCAEVEREPRAHPKTGDRTELGRGDRMPVDGLERIRLRRGDRSERPRVRRDGAVVEDV